MKTLTDLNYALRKSIAGVVLLFFCIELFSQTPFTPVGSRWGGTVHCAPTFFPCPPSYPIDYERVVTEDTIIQGKYCVLIPEHNWEDWSHYTAIHQDSNLIYRHDPVADTFKLLFDFSKDVGESWEMPIPSWMSIYGSNTYTVKVDEKLGTYRLVSIYESGNIVFEGLPLYEGFGGVINDHRLLIGDDFFLVADPIIWWVLNCYMDPDLGVLYGTESYCFVPTTEEHGEQYAFTIYPNPATSYFEIFWNNPLPKKAELFLFDSFGRPAMKESLPSGTIRHTVSLDDLNSGIYFWKVKIDGKFTPGGKVVVFK